MNKDGQISSIAIIGGSFNPLHLAHLRLGVEVYEAVRPTRLDFVPCANPVHKDPRGLLPFELRYAMLKASTAAYPHFHINPLEAERESFSYTVDTLREYQRAWPGVKLYFVLGTEDFALLDTWKEWQSLPELAELLVIARQGARHASFRKNALRLWPDAVLSGSDGREAFRVGKAGIISYLAMPRLDIDASLIRRRWLAGRAVDFWVPREVTAILRDNAAAVKSRWQD